MWLLRKLRWSGIKTIITERYVLPFEELQIAFAKAKEEQL